MKNRKLYSTYMRINVAMAKLCKIQTALKQEKTGIFLLHMLVK